MLATSAAPKVWLAVLLSSLIRRCLLLLLLTALRVGPRTIVRGSAGPTLVNRVPLRPLPRLGVKHLPLVLILGSLWVQGHTPQAASVWVAWQRGGC